MYLSFFRCGLSGCPYHLRVLFSKCAVIILHSLSLLLSRFGVSRFSDRWSAILTQGSVGLLSLESQLGNLSVVDAYALLDEGRPELMKRLAQEGY